MSELIISNMDDRRPIESFIIDKLRTVGAGILDPRHPSFTKEEKLKILMDERTKMYQFDEEVIEKIINIYGQEVKGESINE